MTWVVPFLVTVTTGSRSDGTEPSQSVYATFTGTVELSFAVPPEPSGASTPLLVYSTVTTAVLVVDRPWLSVTVRVAVYRPALA